MRTALIAILMAATVATPVAAQEDDRVARLAAAAERANQQDAPERAERRQERIERRQERQIERENRRVDQPVIEGRREIVRQPREERVERREDRRDVRVDRREDRLERREDRRDDRRDVRVERREDRLERREDRRDVRVERRQDRREWNRAWRNDRRYDWQRYRDANRRLFNVGRYYSPFGAYGYNRFSIGLRLGSPFYSDRYWISDPWQFRLPPAYAGTRWVRYYDDVILVDLYSGQVLDVIHNFFW